MGHKIQIKRGNKPNLPQLDNGEIALSSDTKDVYVGTPTGNQLVGGASITEQLAHTDQQKAPQITYWQNKGQAFSTFSDLETQNPHHSWAFSNVHYDESIDKVVVFYNIKPVHNVINTRLMMRTKDVEGDTFSDAIVVADRNSEGLAVRSQASGIAKNGDYICLSPVIRNSDSVVLGAQVYRSSDKGQTWTSHDLLVNGQPLKTYAGDITGFLTLKSGRLISWATLDDGVRTCKVIYSDDNGYTWNFANIVGNPVAHTEPAWCELSDGTIVCLLRYSVAASFSVKVPAVFTKSVDGGLTWSKPINSTSILDMSEANGAMIYHEDTKLIEFIHHSRYAQADGLTSIYQAVTTEDKAKTGDFGVQTRIGRLNYCGTLPDGTWGDGGYIGACKSKSGVMHAFYYNGSKKLAKIGYLVGRSKPFSTSLDYVVDDTSGERITLIPESNENVITTFYKNGDEKTSLTGGWDTGLIIGTGAITKNADHLKLVLNQGIGEGRQSFKSVNGIDVTNLKYIYATILVKTQSHTGDGSVSAGIAVFNKSNPTSSTDGRIAYQSESQEGINLIKCDVSDLTGVVYPMVMVSKTSAGTSKLVAEVYEIWGESSEYLVNVNSLNNIANKKVIPVTTRLYEEGKEKVWLTGGWVAGTAVGAGTATKNADNLQCSFNLADGVAGKQSFIITNPIDVTNIDKIYATALISSVSGSAKANLIVYNKNNPTSSSDGRLAYIEYGNIGVNNIVLDVSALTGNIYVAVAGAKPGAGAGQIDVKFYDVWY